MQVDSNGRSIQIAIYVGTPQTINLSVSPASVTLSPFSFYRLWSSVDSFFQLSTDGNSPVASTSSHPLKAGLDVLLRTDNLNFTMSAVVSSATGVLFISKIDPVKN